VPQASIKKKGGLQPAQILTN